MKSLYKMHLLMLLLFGFVNSVTFSQTTGISDELNRTNNQIFTEVAEKFKPLKDSAINVLVIRIGLHFLNSPYVANTLEINESEQLVVNLSEFDCTTFAENCLALARTIKSPELSFDSFKRELLKIRYRNGQLTDYTSRLHYFSDWIFNNDQKKIVKNRSCEMGNFRFDNTVNYMSKHLKEYKMLNNHDDLIRKTIAIEKEISKRNSCFIPKNEIFKHQNEIQNGDILGITTNIPGMDMAHVVIAFFQNGKLHILHASSKEHKVVISPVTLESYLAHRPDATGIMVARPL